MRFDFNTKNESLGQGRGGFRYSLKYFTSQILRFCVDFQLNINPLKVCGGGGGCVLMQI